MVFLEFSFLSVNECTLNDSCWNHNQPHPKLGIAVSFLFLSVFPIPPPCLCFVSHKLTHFISFVLSGWELMHPKCRTLLAHILSLFSHRPFFICCFFYSRHGFPQLLHFHTNSFAQRHSFRRIFLVYIWTQWLIMSTVKFKGSVGNFFSDFNLKHRYSMYSLSHFMSRERGHSSKSR